MRVAVLGAGAIGFGTTALLCARGHDALIWSPSGRRTAELARGAPLVATGAVAGSFAPRVAGDCAGKIGVALDGAEAVVIAVPGYAHRAVIDAASPHLRGDQTVVISSHMSMSALYLSQCLETRRVRPPIVAWGTTIVTARQPSLTAVHVSNLRAQVDVATVPATDAETGLGTCRALFGERFAPRDDLLAIALSNLNPQNHLAMALCNFTRIESGEAWVNFAGVTPSVGRLMERLDRERLAVAAAYGHRVRTILEHFRLSYGVDGDTVAEIARAICAREKSPGPVSTDTRYVTEDVPFGLVTTSRLAAFAGVAVPLHDAGIAVFSALYGRDFTAENDLLPKLGLERLSLELLRRAAREGWRAVAGSQPA